MKKGCGIALAIAVLMGAGIASLVLFVFYLTSGAVESADQFLATLARGDSKAAYLQTSSTFRTAQSEPDFEAVIGALGLKEFQSAFWNSRAVENNLATVEGSIQLRSGGTTRLTIKLIKEDGQWKILSLEGPIIGANVKNGEADVDVQRNPEFVLPDFKANAPADVPPKETISSLAERHLTALDRALRGETFDEFYRSLSKTWKAQISENEVASAFERLKNDRGDWSKLVHSELVYDEPPALNEQGVLVVKGHWPIQKRRLVFELKFITEDTGWELLGIKVREVDDPPPMPDDHTLEMLTKTTLLKFNTAVQQRDFNIFHDDASGIFKGQFDPGQLKSEFESFVEKQIDLTWIRDVTPVFDESPHIDRYGVLTLTGHFATQESRVNFDLSHIFERNQWKLTEIGLKLE